MAQNTEDKTDISYGLLFCYDHQSKGVKLKVINEFLKKGNINYQIPPTTPITGKYFSMVGYTALHFAAKSEDYPSFKKLIDNGADYTIKSANGLTALHIILEKLYSKPMSSKTLRKYLDAVLSAHVKFKNYANPGSKSGVSHFDAACIRSRIKAVKLFLKNGESILNERIEADSEIFAGYTPMHFAAHFSSFNVVKLLLNRGAKYDIRDAQGFTPIHLLIKRNMEIKDWINMGKRDCYDDLQMEYEKNEKIITMILEEMIKKEDKNDFDLTILHVACTLQCTEKVKQLCKNKIDLNKCVKKNSSLWPGYTALHFAAHFNPETVKFLLSKAANFFVKNADGLMPFDLYLQRYEIDELLNIMKTIPKWSHIKFTIDEISLFNVLSAMKSIEAFDEFLKNKANINMYIPFDSTLWPGYSLLHLAVTLSVRYQDKRNLYKHRFYNLSKDAAKTYFNCNEKEEQLYLQRIEACLRHGVDLTLKNHLNSTPLHLAFELQKERAVNLFLNSHQVLVDCVNNNKLSYFHIACASENANLIESLLSKNAEHMNLAALTNYKYRRIFNNRSIDFTISAGSTPLHVAVLTRNAKIVQLLVNHGSTDIYARDANGLTPINHVLIEGSTGSESYKEIANALLFFDDLKECKTSFGLSNLHVASYANNVSAIEKLLTNGADIEATIISHELIDEKFKVLNNCDGHTPLHLALKYDCHDAIVALIHCGANILAVPPKIGFVLHNKHSDLLATSVMNELGTQNTVIQNLGLTPLHVACTILDYEKAFELLNQGADPNAQVDLNSPLWPGYTPLHFVLIEREDDEDVRVVVLAEILLRAGADVMIKNAHNSTPVHDDKFPKSRTPYPLSLIRAHTNYSVNPTNNHGLSHFHVACIYDQIEMVEEFLKHGVDPNQSIDYASHGLPGLSPLFLATMLKRDRVVDLLLKYGADLNKRNLNYRTPIHDAVTYSGNTAEQGENENTILNFIKAGADLHIETLLKESPLELFLKERHPITDTFQAFLKKDNHVNIFNPHSGEGFIAMAISRSSSTELLWQNSYYAALINSPELNGPDELGRTPMHNIVSIKKSSPPIEVYVEALQHLSSLGFDIDAQDVNGQAAMHMAMEFQNITGIVALLKLGANVNATDNKGKTTLSLFEKWFNKGYVSAKASQKEILKICLEQLYKMQEVDLYINTINILIMTSFQEYWRLSNEVKEDCINEMEEMKDEQVDKSDLTLLSFLCETSAVVSYPKMRPAERHIIDEFFRRNNSRIIKDFPHFGGLLLLQHRKSKARVELIKLARTSIHFAINYKLPEICCDKILEYLNNDQLKMLDEMQ